MLTPANLKVIKFVSYCCTSDGEPIKSTGRDVCVLFNQTQIDEKEVSKLIDNGMYEYDNRVVVLNSSQLKYLADKELTNE